MENETRTRIMEEALRLFSQKGYAATSVQEIAGAVGIKAPSLYNHFDSKQKIFDAVVDMMTERFGRVSEEEKLPTGEISARAGQYAEGGTELLKSAAHHLFHYYLTDKCASQFGKLLAIERHNDPKADGIYRQIYIDLPIAYQSELFSEMIRQGHITCADPHILSLHFFSPIFLLLDKYGSTPEKESEALTLLDMHIEQFCRVYNKK